MRRSFGGSNGGMGGGGGGSGGMLRTVHRAVRAGVGGANPEPFSHSTANTTTTNTTNRKTFKPTNPNVFSLSASTAQSPFSSFNNPISATSAIPNWTSCSSPCGSDEFDWECVDGSEFERPSSSSYYDDFVFGSVPSPDEVHHAVSALQQVLDPGFSSHFVKDRLAYSSDKDVADDVSSPIGFMRRVSSVGGEMDWIEPSLQLRNPTILHSYGRDRVFDAFHLLQNEPSIQRMVVSLSSDRAVWDAVSNNEVVRELREAFGAAVNKSAAPEELDPSLDDSDAATSILSWIFDNTKAKVMELLEKLSKLVNELFPQPPPEKEKIAEGGKDPFEEKLRASFFLSIMVLLIVVVSRGYKGPA